MKKTLLVISLMFVFAISAIGCATKGDLEKVQAQEQQTNLKVDQALKASQEANQSARAAEERARLAEERARAAEERARLAEEKAARADTMFERSMKK